MKLTEFVAKYNLDMQFSFGLFNSTILIVLLVIRIGPNRSSMFKSYRRVIVDQCMLSVNFLLPNRSKLPLN